MTVNLWMFSEHTLTDEEKTEINAVLARARDRLIAQGERNGYCPCRCKRPLDDDGSNSCWCCNEPKLDIPDDLI